MLKSLLALVVLGFTSPAWSLAELKVTYTNLMSEPKEDKFYNGSAEAPSLKQNSGIGGDLIFTLPILGVSIGARYESLGLDAKKEAVRFETEATRTAVLLGWRWVDTLVYFGPIFSYGVSHSGGKIKASDASTTYSDLVADSQSSYSAGLELGAKLLGFRLGAEAGYMSYEWKKLSGTTGSITTVDKLDMGGTYVKVSFGFGI